MFKILYIGILYMYIFNISFDMHKYKNTTGD